MGRLVVLAALAAALVAATAQPADSSRYLRVGIYDEAQTLYGPVDKTFAFMKQLRVQEVRLNLYWGGKYGVARRRPARATSPNDPAYNWSLYDRTVKLAAAAGVHVMFAIYGTPAWANGGRPAKYAPTRPTDLRNFAYAAATRYNGRFKDAQGLGIPAVKEWLAWNEPNNPIFLAPQYRRTAKGWTIVSAEAYAKICNAIYNGVHGTLNAGERVGCGATAPRGNNNPNSSRASVSPLAFLRAAKKSGLKRFDAWAHHPYYSGPSDEPTTVPVTAKGAPATAVTLGNISDLIREVTRLYGNKRIWITEYGYQTNPPDRLFGVSWARQSAYLTQAFGIARRSQRIDMMLWFLLKDEAGLNGWQSGLMTIAGRKKPSYTAFQRLKH